MLQRSRTFPCSMRALLALAALSLAGCVQMAPVRPASSYDLDVTSQTKDVSEKNYELGVETSAYVGQAMVRVRQYQSTVTSTGSQFTSPVPISFNPLFGGERTFPAGTTLNVWGMVQHEGAEYFALQIMEKDAQWIALLVDKSGHYSGTNFAIINRLVLPNGSQAKYSPESITFTRQTKESVSNSGAFVNYELVYSGTTKDSINLLYREFTADDLAKPAFSQSLVYAKDESTVRFRDLVLEVREATNEAIRFVVVSDGSDKAN